MLDSLVFYRLVFFFFFGLIGLSAQAQVDSLLIQEGTASYYGKKFQGRKTSSGEVFHLDSMTAAHKNLPFGTWVRVTRVGREESVLVRVNDRLPQRSSHVIDVSRAAAEILGLIQPGYAQVRIEAVNLRELDRLVEFFKDKEHPGMRIRPYYQGIVIPKRKLNMYLGRYKPNYCKNFLIDFQRVKN